MEKTLLVLAAGMGSRFGGSKQTFSVGENGEFIIYYENGQIRVKTNFKNWKPDWDQIWYYEDGSLLLKWNYKNFKWILYFYEKDWSLIWTWEKIYTNEFDENTWEYKSTYNWLWIDFYDNGQIKDISNLKDWELDWKQTLYYENGQIKSICEYTEWVRTWECVVYDENWEKI